MSPRLFAVGGGYKIQTDAVDIHGIGSSIFGKARSGVKALSFLCRSGPASKKGVSKNDDFQATPARRVTAIKW